ncbi:MAG: serine acetyltransferase, partial [Erysipelotrichaceae bacterium]|nr:serine acetyltransferase [Erysipelotrichaceae bacterium]
GFQATFLYRIAHELYELDVPILPRLISEYAHEKTGIDIHPGAKIGEAFCIDHGTGIVIGETALIGHHVRIYHGVTLGVRNFRKDEEGNLLKGGKRHPNIGDHVILYANATILGGDTTIASGTAVPANALILHTPETFL